MLYESCVARDTLVSLIKVTNEYRGGLHTMRLVRQACPACGSQQFKKDGPIHHGKENHYNAPSRCLLYENCSITSIILPKHCWMQGRDSPASGALLRGFSPWPWAKGVLDLVFLLR